MASPLEEHEKFIRKRLEDPESRKAEALAWLEGSQGRNTLGEPSQGLFAEPPLLGLDPSDASIALVKAIYAMGAQEVIAVEIDQYEEDDGTYENTGKLVIKLPVDPALRRSVFAWHGKQAQSMGFDAEPDIGQSHLFSMLD